jgi:hypothetical protein
VEGLLPKKAEVSADDVLWRYSRPGQVNKKADPEAETLAAYDITIISRKGDFQPEAGESVSVSIQNENISSNKDLEVWHLKDNGTVEVIRGAVDLSIWPAEEIKEGTPTEAVNEKATPS